MQESRARRVPPLSFKHLFYLSLASFGMQFGGVLQTSETAAIFSFLGADGETISYLWLAAPVAGLIIQPVVGQFSDSTMTRFGKRMPYILAWGVLAVFSLIGLPFATHLWVGALFIWLLSCSLNGCSEATRALIGDMTSSQDKARGFAWQSIFSGVGASCASILPWALAKSHLLPRVQANLGHLPLTIQLTLFIGAGVLALCVFALVWKVKERAFIKKHLLHTLKAGRQRSRTQNVAGTLRELLRNIRRMPRVIRSLALIQLFTWIGIYAIWLYLAIAMAQHIYGLPVDADIASDATYHHVFEKGTLMANVCTGIYQIVSVAFAFFIPRLTERFSLRAVHGASLFIGAVSLMGMAFTTEKAVIYLLMVGVGIMWGSVVTMPVAIVASELPRSKMGVYLGVFNITVTVPQILAGLFLGKLVTGVFRNHAILALALAGFFILIAALILAKQLRASTPDRAPSPSRLVQNVAGELEAGA